MRTVQLFRVSHYLTLKHHVSNITEHPIVFDNLNRFHLAACVATGLNIDSLAVGLNVDTALFTITVTCTQSLAEQMLDRVVALPKVAPFFIQKTW